MADVFISYSRKDREFVKGLHAALIARGRDARVDWEDLSVSEEGWKAIQAAIAAAHTFVFVITSDSLASKVCNDEAAYARQRGKRIVPLIRRDIDEKAIAGEWFDKEWETQARENWRTLKGQEIDKAKAWLAAAESKEPRPTALHTGYILASRKVQR